MSDRGIQFDITARDEASAKVDLLVGELTKLQTSLAKTQLAIARGFPGGAEQVEALRASILKTKNEVIGLALAYEALANKTAIKFDRAANTFVPSGAGTHDSEVRNKILQTQAINAMAAKEAQQDLNATLAQGAEKEAQFANFIASSNAAQLQNIAAKKAAADAAARYSKTAEESAATLKKVTRSDDLARDNENEIKRISLLKTRADAERGLVTAERNYSATKVGVMGIEPGVRAKESAQVFMNMASDSDRLGRAISGAGTRAQRAFEIMRTGSNRAVLAVRHLVAIVDEIFSGRRGQLMSSTGALARDSGVGTAGLLGSVGGLVAIGSVTAITSAISKYNREIGEAALKQAGFAAAIGMSAGEFSQFSAVMQLAGGNAETATRAIESISKHMEEAVKNPQSGGMDAFRQIGLSWEELRQRLSDPSGTIKTLEDLRHAFSSLNEESRRATLQLLGVRQASELAHYLMLSDEEAKKLNADSRELNEYIASHTTQLQKVGQQYERVTIAGENLKAAISQTAFSSQFETSLEHLYIVMRQITEGSRSLFPNNPHAGFGGMGMGMSEGASVGMGMPGVAASHGLASGLQPGFASALEAMIADASSKGIKIGLGSGFRDAALQGQLYAQDIAQHGGRASGMVAEPGHSMHGLGLADDLRDGSGLKISPHTVEDQYLQQNLGYFGLTRPMNDPTAKVYEPWHVEPQGARGGRGSTPMAPPEGVDEAALESAYRAQLSAAKSQAESNNQHAKAVALAQEELNFDRLSVTAKSEKLRNLMTTKDAQGNLVVLGAAEAKQAGQVAGDTTAVASAQKAAAEYAQQSAIAQLNQAKATAESKGNTEEAAKIQERIAAIIKGSPYESDAAKIQAETEVLQANLKVHQHKLQLLQEEYSAQARANADIERGSQTANMARTKHGGGLTGAQAYGLDISQVELAAEAQQKLLTNMMRLADEQGNLDERVKIYWQEWDLGVATISKVNELLEKQAEAMRQANEKAVEPLKKFFDSAGSAFENFFGAAISRTETLRKAISQLVTSLGKDLAGGIGGTISEMLAKSLSGGAQSSIGGLLASKVGGLFGLGTQTATTAASATAFTTAITTGGLTAATEMATSITTAGATAGATMAAEISAAGAGNAAGGAVGGILGKAASVVGGLFFAQGGIVPSAAGGMVVGGGGVQFGILHPQEMVLPAHLSKGLQNMISRGGGGGSSTTQFNYNANVSGYHPYGSRTAFESMLRTHGGTLQDWAGNLMRNRSFA